MTDASGGLIIIDVDLVTHALLAGWCVVRLVDRMRCSFVGLIDCDILPCSGIAVHSLGANLRAMKQWGCFRSLEKVGAALPCFTETCWH